MIDKFVNKIHRGNSLDILKQMPDNSVDNVITSPPYWQLRLYQGIPDYIWDGKEDCEHDFSISVESGDFRHRAGHNTTVGNNLNEKIYAKKEEWHNKTQRYGTVETNFCSKCGAWRGQLGLEPTFNLYLEHLWLLMEEIYRILKPTGTAWINLGDTYGGGSGVHPSGKTSKIGNDAGGFMGNLPNKGGIDKCLLLIPHRFAIGCIDRGWIVRNDIIWAKRNSMPESVIDRFSKKHEFVFFMVKQQKYYFDLEGIRDKHKQVSIQRNNYGRNKDDHMRKLKPGEFTHKNGKNPGDISDFWDINTKGSSEKHYASFNFELIEKPIVAGSPEGGIVLDPFCGISVTLVRALQLGRRVIGIDGSSEYCAISRKKIAKELNQLKMFA